MSCMNLALDFKVYGKWTAFDLYGCSKHGYSVSNLLSFLYYLQGEGDILLGWKACLVYTLSVGLVGWVFYHKMCRFANKQILCRRTKRPNLEL